MRSIGMIIMLHTSGGWLSRAEGAKHHHFFQSIFFNSHDRPIQEVSTFSDFISAINSIYV